MDDLEENHVTITEVGPRDGIQNHARLWSATERITLISRLLNCHTTSSSINVEFGAFVNPKRVPNMAGSKELFQDLMSTIEETEVREQVRENLIGLVPNMRGLSDAVGAGVKHIAVFLSASESFSQANIGMSIMESLENYRVVIESAKNQKCIVRAYISCGWWCPYEGRISSSTVQKLIEQLDELSCDQIVIADTIGTAKPNEITALLDEISDMKLSNNRIGLHFHDTAGHALKNVDAALSAGFRRFDAAIAGLGGCPFAPGAPGNLSTLSLVKHLNEKKISTNIDENKIQAVHNDYSNNLNNRQG